LFEEVVSDWLRWCLTLLAGSEEESEEEGSEEEESEEEAPRAVPIKGLSVPPLRPRARQLLDDEAEEGSSEEEEEGEEEEEEGEKDRTCHVLVGWVGFNQLVLNAAGFTATPPIPMLPILLQTWRAVRMSCPRPMAGWHRWPRLWTAPPRVRGAPQSSGSQLVEGTPGLSMLPA
jgi:hypothetical protein